jgi:hypothetical protein
VGVLTETTMRLREEMVAWRHMRMALRGDLVRQTDERRIRVSALCAGFAGDRAGAHRAWFGPALFEGHAAERRQQRGLAEAAKAKAPTEEQALATPTAESRRREPANEPVPAPAARPPVAPLPRAKRGFLKRLKKH